jgi:hypothetical protein
LANQCFRGKAINITYLCVCVCAFVLVPGRVDMCMRVRVALLIQHAKRMRQIVTWFVAHFIPPNFSTLSHKRHDLKKKKSYWTQNVFWFSLQPLSKTFLILRRI